MNFIAMPGTEAIFSYDLDTKSETNLSLLIRYWGAEWGSRKFDIYIDDEKLLTEDNTGKWNLSMFKNVVYPIPDSMLKGKIPYPGQISGSSRKYRRRCLYCQVIKGRGKIDKFESII